MASTDLVFKKHNFTRCAYWDIIQKPILLVIVIHQLFRLCEQLEWRKWQKQEWIYVCLQIKYYYWKEPTARLIPESKSVRVLINLEIVLPDLESSSDLIRLWLIVISGVFQLLRKILPSWLITLFNQHLFVHMCSRDINVVDSEISKIDEETRIMIEELTDEVQQLFPYEKNITPSLLTRLYTTAKSNHAKQLIAIMNDIQNVELREYLLNVVRTS